MGSFMSRYPDWPERLWAFVEDRRRAPFVWAQNDCALFAADGVLALTGTDPAKAIRRRYTTATGAARLIKRAGGLGDLAASVLPNEINPRMAQRGDVVLYTGTDEEPTLGLCIGSEAVSPGPDGLMLTPMARALRAWRV